MATAAKDINWDEFDFDAIPEETRDADIRAIRDVPPSLVAMAQKSWDEKIWIKRIFRGQSPQFVATFADLMKGAGDHTTPQTSMIVNHEENSIIVEFRATERRGRKPGQKATTTTNGEKPTETDPKAKK